MPQPQIAVRVTEEVKEWWEEEATAASPEMSKGDIFAEMVKTYKAQLMARDHPDFSATLRAYDKLVADLRDVLLGQIKSTDALVADVKDRAAAELEEVTSRAEELAEQLREERERAAEAAEAAEAELRSATRDLEAARVRADEADELAGRLAEAERGARAATAEAHEATAGRASALEQLDGARKALAEAKEAQACAEKEAAGRAHACELAERELAAVTAERDHLQESAKSSSAMADRLLGQLAERGDAADKARERADRLSAELEALKTELAEAKAERAAD